MKSINRKSLQALVLLAGFSLMSSPLLAYQTRWDDPKVPGKESSGEKGTDLTEIPESEFKVDGVIYSGYEFPTHSATGRVQDPGGDNTGFNLERVYVNIRGSVKEGPLKGWGFRFTPDLALASSLRNDVNCKQVGTCVNGNDDRILYAKYAYMDIPLAREGKTALRFGLQPLPTVSPSTGSSMMSVWDHRYLGVHRANAPFGIYGLSSTADNGISLIHTDDYYGVQLLFANGEGYHKTNADNFTNSTNLVSLSRGSGNSYGYDVYGNLSLIPTGKAKDFQLAVNLPFRFQNVTGIEGTELKHAYADFTDLTDPQYMVIQSDSRSKRDESYGVEIDATMDLDFMTQTFGAGYVQKKDRRGTAIKLDNTVLAGISPTDYKTITSHWHEEEDQLGNGAYVFAHFKAGQFGGFVRYMTGVGTGTLSPTLGTRTSKPWINQALQADANDGTLGNMTYLQMANVEQGKSRFHSTIVGATYHATERYRISLGAYTLHTTTTNGKPYKENDLQYVTGLNKQDNLAAQIENNDAIKSQLGYSSADTLNLNDFIGKKTHIQEVFIKMQYIF